MTQYLPPLRLTGAMTLRDGAMNQRTVALAEGRISTGPYPAVDLSGYYVLPGVVDMGSRAVARHLPHLSLAAAIDQSCTDLASAGITTGWIRHELGWVDQGDPFAAGRAMAEHLRGLRDIPDLRLQAQIETMITSSNTQIDQFIADTGVDMVLFSDQLSHKLAWAETEPTEFAHWARGLGRDPALLLTHMRGLFDQRRDIPRTLCRLAENFDARGVCYGSLGDHDGETRETYSILGAKLCVAPASHAAASIAYAVGDPTILPASWLGAKTQHMINLPALLKSGRCQALCSDAYPGSLVQTAFALADQGVCAFAKAWDMISTNPAQIMRLPDRGQIAPGKRADLTIVDPRTRQVAATISGGRLIFGRGEIMTRFMQSGAALDMAAQ